MKKLLTILTLTAFAAIQSGALAAEPDAATPAPSSKAGVAAKAKIDKAAAALNKASAPAATPAPATPAAKIAVAKPMAMYSEVATIDAAGKSFTHKNKDGKEVKFVITDKTEIKNGDAAAKLEDIKVGDYVSGSRLKKSETEYEVVKITKFGPKTEKKVAAPAGATPAVKATPVPKKP